MHKSVAIVQSNYIPWKGYFDLINLVDEFIIFDDMQYTRRDWRNRNKIKTPSGLMWLTIPIKVKNRYFQKICESIISDPLWNKKHWKAIRLNYSRTFYFNNFTDIFEELYLGSDEKKLSDLNFRFIKVICNILGIDSKLSWSMDYNLIEGKTERLVDLCKQSGATSYLSGPSAKGYIDEDLFESEGIDLEYINYSMYPEYTQMHPPFEHGVSIIDLIFNEGPNAPKFMLSF